MVCGKEPSTWSFNPGQTKLMNMVPAGVGACAVGLPVTCRVYPQRRVLYRCPRTRRYGPNNLINKHDLTPSSANMSLNVPPPLLASSNFFLSKYQHKSPQWTGKWRRSRRKGNRKQRKELKGPRWATPLGRSTYPWTRSLPSRHR